MLARCADGDPDALERLYRRYRPDLFKMCMGRLRDSDAAEDLVQETFVRALSNISRLDLERHPWPWLRTIADRLCTTFAQRHRRVLLAPRLSLEHDSPAGHRDGRDVTVESVLRRDDGLRLVRALQTLPPRQRQMLLLYVIEGWSYADIAATEGLSIAALKSTMFRARASVRRVLE
ncbi:MAG TPA: RNA polymerase sigma factor [Actinomycetota bacterium]